MFQPIATADFKQLVDEAEELVHGTAEDTDTKVETHDDEFGYRWIVLRDPDFEDLVVSLNAVSTELQGGGYGDRLLACVFAFEEEGKPLYFIYNFKRGSFYPFVPAPGDQQRDTEREMRLQAQIGGGAALREGDDALVPALGDPALAVVGEQVAGLAVERVAEGGQRGEADSARAAVLQDREVHHRHVHALGQLGQRHAPLLEQPVEAHGDAVLGGVGRHLRRCPRRPRAGSGRRQTPPRG